ncbi:general stress protein [Aestuariivirga sp.]|uniref:general stress protein n=1 Tax=Aestuariivirga sp. TaxID=2650926 RepID=UPI0039E226FE
MKTVHRVYDNYADAEQAVRNLKDAGIPDADISIIGNRGGVDSYKDVAYSNKPEATEAGLGVGAAVGGGAGLLAGLGLLAIPGLGPVVAAGWLAATALGAVTGAAAGGIVGALVDAGVPEQDAHVYSEAIRRGGTMVTVRYPDELRDRVIAAFDVNGFVDIARRRTEYETAGWQRFDPEAGDYKPTPADIERTRRYG